MPMDYHHQLGLLSDILKNQQAEHYGTIDENAQIKRLAQSLLNNENLDHNLKQTLASIEHYCDQGTAIQDEGFYDNWLTVIDQTEHYS